MDAQLGFFVRRELAQPFDEGSARIFVRASPGQTAKSEKSRKMGDSDTAEKCEGKRRRPEQRKRESRHVEYREKSSSGIKQTRDGMGMSGKLRRKSREP